MYCRNYLQQYSRTKSIREISKNNRNSYKVISQQNSALVKKEPSRSQTKTDEHNKSIQKNMLVMKGSINRIKTNLQIRKNEHQSIKSISSIALHSDVDVQCRKSTIGDKTASSSIKKCPKIEKSLQNLNKNIQLAAINKKKSIGDKNQKKEKSVFSQNVPNKKLSISKIKNNSQYSTVTQTNPNTRYNSVVNVANFKDSEIRQEPEPEKYSVEMKVASNKTLNPLQHIYNRMKGILQANQGKQRQWQRQRSYYVNKIAQLEEELNDYHKTISVNPQKKNRKRV